MMKDEGGGRRLSSFCEVKAMVSIGMCIAVGVIAFIVGSLSGADCDIEERNKPEV